MNMIALMLFVLAAGLLWTRNIRYVAMFLAAQGTLLALMVWINTPLTWATSLIGLTTLTIKAGLIPWLIRRILSDWPLDIGQDHPLPLWAYGAAIFVVLAVVHLEHVVQPTHLVHHPAMFFYALSTIHLGLVMIIARRHLLSQLAALVSIENGLVVLATSLSGALPAFVELGILADLSLAAILFVWTSQRIQVAFKFPDVTMLSGLKG